MKIGVYIGTTASGQDLSSHVGIGSSSQDFDGNRLSILRVPNVDAGSKLSKIILLSWSSKTRRVESLSNVEDALKQEYTSSIFLLEKYCKAFR